MASMGPAAPIASIGVPREIKRDEQRVALSPDGVRELVSQGLEVRVEAGAGQGAGMEDASYAEAGARLVRPRGGLGRPSGGEGEGTPAGGVPLPAR